MTFSESLIKLARYLAGEFDNREQAIADPAWFVHLRLWQRPVPLFTQDSITLFAEQANVLQLDRPYRQRILRLRDAEAPNELEIQFYAFKDPALVKGAGRSPEVLEQLTPEQIELLPGCHLTVHQSQPSAFTAFPAPDARCYFTYEGEVRQVVLGFEVSHQTLLAYDKGVDPETGKALWGAILGPYQFTKRQDFAINSVASQS